MKVRRRGKSWWLADAQKLAAEFPYTFHKPSAAAISLLRVADEVKLIFRFDSDDPDAPNAERMWVAIKEISGTTFHGLLDNDPVHIQDLKCGDPVTFAAKHIIQVSIEDPVPSQTDRYLPRCFVTRRILDDGQKIAYLYREQPDRAEDSGWRFLAGDETEAYMDDPANICRISLGAALRADDSILHLLESPVGSSFELDRATGEFVAIDA